MKLKLKNFFNRLKCIVILPLLMLLWLFGSSFSFSSSILNGYNGTLFTLYEYFVEWTETNNNYIEITIGSTYQAITPHYDVSSFGPFNFIMRVPLDDEDLFTGIYFSNMEANETYVYEWSDWLNTGDVGLNTYIHYITLSPTVTSNYSFILGNVVATDSSFINVARQYTNLDYISMYRTWENADTYGLQSITYYVVPNSLIESYFNYVFNYKTNSGYSDGYSDGLEVSADVENLIDSSKISSVTIYYYRSANSLSISSYTYSDVSSLISYDSDIGSYVLSFSSLPFSYNRLQWIYINYTDYFYSNTLLLGVGGNSSGLVTGFYYDGSDSSTSVYDVDTYIEYASLGSTVYTNRVQINLSNSSSNASEYDEIYFTLKQYNALYSAGYTVGYDDGYDVGELAGYESGYSDGVDAGIEENNQQFYSLVSALVSAPFTFLDNALNFDLFGINLLAIAFAFVTIGILVFILKRLI